MKITRTLFFLTVIAALLCAGARDAAHGQVANGALRAQDSDAVMQRGNSARTAAFTARGIRQVNEVAWKSPPLFSMKPTRRGPRAELSAALVAALVGQNSEEFFSRTFYIGTLLYSRGTLFFTLYVGDGYIVAIDARDGQRKWVYKKARLALSDPAIVDGVVYFGDQRGNLYALDAETGDEKWQFTDAAVASIGLLGRAGNPLWSPIVSGGVAYYSSYKGKLYALDLGTRKLLWVFNGKGPVLGPSVAGEIVYAADQESLYAFDAKTGRTLWKRKGRSGVTVAAEGVLYFDDHDNLFAVDGRTGAQKWKAKAGGEVGTFLAYADKTIIYGGWDRDLHAVDAETGREKWKYKTRVACDSPVIASGTVYSGSLGQLYAVDAETGQEKFVVNAKDVEVLSPAVFDGVIYVLRSDGYVYALR